MKLRENSNRGFYKDIDERNKKKSCCTCQTMLIGFGILFVLGAIGVGWLFRAVTSPDLEPLRKVIPSQQALENYQNKLSQAMSEALLKEVTGGGDVTLVITEEELTSFLASQQDKMENDRVAVKEVSMVITPQFLEAYGQLVKPIKSRLKIIFLPSVKDGRLKVNIKTVEAGKVKLPKFIIGELNVLLEGAIQESVKRGSITYITGLELRDGELAITGRMN
jgi:hypothetical protein